MSKIFRNSRKGSEMAVNTPIYMVLGLLVLGVGIYFLVTTGGNGSKAIASIQACGNGVYGKGECKPNCDDSSELTFDGLGCKDKTPKCCILKNAPDSTTEPAKA